MKERKQKQAWWVHSILFFTKVSSYIVLPLIVSLFVGKFLDSFFHTEPWILLFLLLLSFSFSLFLLFKELTKIHFN